MVKLCSGVKSWIKQGDPAHLERRVPWQVSWFDCNFHAKGTLEEEVMKLHLEPAKSGLSSGSFP